MDLYETYKELHFALIHLHLPEDIHWKHSNTFWEVLLNKLVQQSTDL